MKSPIDKITDDGKDDDRFYDDIHEYICKFHSIL